MRPAYHTYSRQRALVVGDKPKPRTSAHVRVLYRRRTGGYVIYWRILAKALGEKAHPDPRIADRIAMVRLVILLSYLLTNTFIVAGVLRHWNGS